jgi:hypothetical protein
MGRDANLRPGENVSTDPIEFMKALPSARSQAKEKNWARNEINGDFMP